MLKGFLKKFGIGEDLDAIKIKNDYYLVEHVKEMMDKIPERPIYAGTYLGKKQNEYFQPSLYLLGWLNERTGQKIVVDDKAAWLFICRRDLFRGGIVGDIKKLTKNAFVLVLNEKDECLGFGNVVMGKNIFIKNLFDVGDFLRREKKD